MSVGLIDKKISRLFSLCQKTYTLNTFPFERKANTGEADQVYIENTHPAIIDRKVFSKVQTLLRKKAERKPVVHQEYIFSRKITCVVCGSLFQRRVDKRGVIRWGCRRHEHKASDCPVGRIPEAYFFAAFVRMYNRLKQNEGIVLRPMLEQLDDLRTALLRENPAMLAVNQAIAQAAEQSHNISKLQSAGLLDAETLRQTAEAVPQGPERLDGFDEGLFDTLVERIVMESQTHVRFRLWGGLELVEQLQEAVR